MFFLNLEMKMKCHVLFLQSFSNKIYLHLNTILTAIKYQKLPQTILSQKGH